ncbi:growth-regulating factor 6-like [Typha angustifolia]|uniref:growth-regulating factor 6-like n=1 Tax=Typha angustifolia TaxID=59011 RepID=UPI003C2BD005
MELGGVVGMDGFVGASQESGGGVFSSPLTPSESELSRQRGLIGSAFLKHGRSSSGTEEHDWRFLKTARTEAMLTAPNKAAPSLLGSNSHPLFPDGEQMLSFSSSGKPDSMVLSSDGSLPYYHKPSPSSSTHSYLRNPGLGCGSSNASMPGVLARVRGPFTPSQWMELEHQALIYKYIVASVPIPASLLIPVRRSLNPSGFTPFPGGSFGSSSLGWGSFHLGYSGNADPEPGRCRRTDGKKWRCSRDAVAEQKYCERHMNRGRHRSRKHVEGHAGHAAKAINVIASSQSASAVSGGGSSGSLTIAQQQTKSLGKSPANFNRMVMGIEKNDHVQDSQDLSMLTSMNQKPIDTLFPISKQQNPFEETSSRADFGLVSTDYLMNSQRSSSDNINSASTPKLNEQPQTHSLRHFIDDWPRNQSDCSAITWPEVEEMQSDRTQLSISIPMASSDFSSSSSPNHEQLKLSPLRLSRDLDSVQMGLGMGDVLSEVSEKQASWIPISWESSIGGPLGEVLTNTSNTPKDQSKNCSSSSLNLLTDGWDSSPRLDSSPTGVLQKTTYNSLSSSTGSSPRPEHHKTLDSAGSLCNDLLGPTLVNPLTIPSL